jgi:FPC/CPF motif-containing protein YcgG
VFDKILNTTKAAEAVFATIHNRLLPYDYIQPSPHLGRYGDPNNREYQQYFLDDDNGAVRCPFPHLGNARKNVA